jgi:asparagine synthase (glutamine-hydrolysing)
MCGIAGYIGSAGAVQASPATLHQMADAIAHRGPDDEGFFHHDGDVAHVGLAHRRLAIIDLNSGHQPIGNETGRIQIVFNGEIYNYQALRAELIAAGHAFRTNSDTETIVHAYEQWGDDCVTRLRGMFAFALWDGDRQRLLLARDRFGKKPLFLLQHGETLLFASEIKALLGVPGVRPEVEPGVLAGYLAYRYVPGPRTLLRGIRKLQPGSLAAWERGRLVERGWYQPPDATARVAGAVPSDPAGAFLEQLDEAVRIRMVADVPFGAFLSGGIDSSAIVALMARHSEHAVRTFSVGFAEGAYSELGYAREVAQAYRTEHHELTVTQAEMVEYLPHITRLRDAPVSEPSDVPIFLLSREARRTVKMVLTGEGSDEFLGGYPKHVFERWAPALGAVPAPLYRHAIEPLVRALPYRARRIKTAALTLGIRDWATRMPRWFGALSPEEGQALLDPAIAAQALAVGLPHPAAGNSALRAILNFDQTSWLPDNLLERGDRMTMGASIEARMPFMDHELAAFVATLPDEWRVRGRTTKRILRLAMARLLPARILSRPKVGFRVPVNEWFRGPLRAYVHDHLTGSDSYTRAYYQRATLDRYLQEHAAGQQNHEKLIWTLLGLEIWHRAYGLRA